MLGLFHIIGHEYQLYMISEIPVMLKILLKELNAHDLEVYFEIEQYEVRIYTIEFGEEDLFKKKIIQV